MGERGFVQVDVFGSGPLRGNPLAVVLDAEGLSDARMLALTRWANLSETAFLLPPSDGGADYRVRIFTPAGELPFAGHPTLGSAAAWLGAGGTPATPGRVVQECGVGLVPVRVDGDRLAFAAPPLRRGGPLPEDLLADLVAVAGLAEADVVDAAWVDNGPGWAGLLLRDAAAVLGVRADPGRWRRDEALFLGLAGPHDADGPADLEVRALFSDVEGIREDPVTGSLNASLAQWLTGAGRLPGDYVARQGTALGRDGRVRVTTDPDGTTWVGGQVRTHVRGTVDLDADASVVRQR